MTVARVLAGLECDPDPQPLIAATATRIAVRIPEAWGRIGYFVNVTIAALAAGSDSA